MTVKVFHNIVIIENSKTKFSWKAQNKTSSTNPNEQQDYATLKGQCPFKQWKYKRENERHQIIVNLNFEYMKNLGPQNSLKIKVTFQSVFQRLSGDSLRWIDEPGLGNCFF